MVSQLPVGKNNNKKWTNLITKSTDHLFYDILLIVTYVMYNYAWIFKLIRVKYSLKYRRLCNELHISYEVFPTIDSKI